MGIEKYFGQTILTVALLLISLVFGVYANTTPTESSGIDTILQNSIEKVDTIWIDDTVWEKDSSLFLHPEQTPAVDTTRSVHDSIASTGHDTSELSQIYNITVYGRRVTGKDETVRPTTTQGKEIRETLRSTPLEELSQSSADVFISSKGTGLHGVSSGASGGIYIRGLGGSPNSQILVVEDGAPDYQGIFGHPIPDAFFPSLIDRVMVIKGGDGVLYGTNAMGGVIIVENRWPDSSGLHIENDAAYGSYNTIRERATLLCKGKKSDIVSAVSIFHTDGHRDGTGGNSAAGQVGMRLHLPGSATLIIRDKLLRLQGEDPGVDFRPWTEHWYDVIRNNLSAQIDFSGKEYNCTITPWLNTGVHRLYDGFLSHDLTAGASVEITGCLIDRKLQYLAGTAGEYVNGKIFERDTIVRRLPFEAFKNGDIYGQFTVKPGLALTGVFGGRLHYNNLYGMIPLVKAGITWDPFEPVALHTRVTKNFRQPTFRELYLPYPVANDSLRPETAVNWDAGLDINAGKLRLSCSLFRTLATDMIKYFGMPPSSEVVNIDKIKIWGVETEIAVHDIGPLNLFLTGSWQDVGRFTKQNPDAKINGRISYNVKREHGTMELAIDGEYVHDLYMNNYARVEDKIPDLYFLDGSIRYRSHIRKTIPFEPYLIIRNLLNSRYEYIKFYRMPGINLLAGITIKV